MLKNFRSLKILAVLLFFLTNSSFAQDKYKFTVEKKLDATSVKNQGNSGSCWCFATCSLLESEMLRKGMEQLDFSEMYLVRCAFIEKAILYVRMHGKSNFGQGGEAHDVTNMMRKYGMVPKSEYSGTKENNTIYDHDKLEIELRSYLDTLIKKTGEGKLPDNWMKAYEKILNNEMGKVPAKFEFEGKKYTPQTYLQDYLKINPDDYVEFTSFTHHPYYSKFFLEIPDNWSFDLYNNVKMDEITELIDSSLAKGYTVGWGGDVSEREFQSKKGVAIVPEKDWEHKSDEERKRTGEIHETELKITPELRQKEFDNWQTTDDHFMHIVGIAKDQYGDKFYITKNSWGASRGFDGYLYMSEAYVKLKLTTLMVNKSVIPTQILQENGIK
jgi:bleomycin hydrolase